MQQQEEREDLVQQFADQALGELTELGGRLNPDGAELDRGWATLRDLFAKFDIEVTTETVLAAQALAYFLVCRLPLHLRLQGGDPLTALGAVAGEMYSVIFGLGHVFTAEQEGAAVRHLFDGLDIRAGDLP